jgi:phosphohistidine phosphatase SixA
MTLLYRYLQCLLIVFSMLPFSTVASDLSDRLTSGSHVLLMRHAYAPGVGDPPGYSLDRCETQRVLDAKGKDQSVRIGRWLKAQGVSQARVFSSPWCRCQQTAELLALGKVTIEPSLASFFDQPQQAAARNTDLQDFIAKAMRAPSKQPLVLVTHHVNILELVGKNIGSGDMVLAQFDATGRVTSYQLIPSP